MRQHLASAVLVVCALFVAGCTGRSTVSTAARKEQPVPRRYACPRTSGPVVIDGRLDEPAWAAAPWTSYFVDIEGSAKPPPRYKTRAKMIWDDANLYIGAELEEPHVWGTLKTHDEIVFHDNDFEIFIDPNGDACEYFEIEVNPLNTIFDLLLERTYRAGGPARHDWDMEGMRSAVAVQGTLNDPRDTDTGWSVEFALPWTTLAEYAHVPTPPQAGDTWRVNFSRVEWRHRIVEHASEKLPDTPESNWGWSPQGVVDMHLPELWGGVEFVK